MFNKKYRIEFGRKIFSRESYNCIMDTISYVPAGPEMQCLYKIQEEIPFTVLDTDLKGCTGNHITIKCKKKDIDKIYYIFMMATQDILIDMSLKETY